jgi:lipopolysaccharide/colanic/teichoic acid biosynthesis glycosyltransferase
VTFGSDTVAVCFSRRTLRLKRALDIVAGTLVGIFLSPVLLCLAVAVVLDSRGGALFRQSRLGIQGRPFTMYKFRTMVPGAANMGDGLACYGEDPRVTRVGKFLRRWSLDELPQLWNIITGDMSLVGPRPPVVDELGPLDRLPPEALIRFCVKPGVSGLAQVSGRNELSWPEKIVYDAEYVERLRREGLVLDFKIAIGTLGVLFSKRGLYDIKGKNQNLS